MNYTDIVGNRGAIIVIRHATESLSDGGEMESLGCLRTPNGFAGRHGNETAVVGYINCVRRRHRDRDGFVGLECRADVGDDALGDKRPRGVVEEDATHSPRVEGGR